MPVQCTTPISFICRDNVYIVCLLRYVKQVKTFRLTHTQRMYSKLHSSHSKQALICVLLMVRVKQINV